ncbi:HNH endonuclease [Actinomyces gerencseriae]
MPTKSPAVCNLPHAQLLEASHIIADSKEAGAPEVSNGLALCRLDHTAYDRHLLGIDADLRIHVATRAKSIETVRLQTRLLKLEGHSLTHVPTSKQMQPDGDRLAEHFEDSLEAEAQTIR